MSRKTRLNKKETKKSSKKLQSKDIDNPKEFKIKENEKKKKSLKPLFFLLIFITIFLGVIYSLSYLKWKKLALLIFNNEASIVYNSENEEIARIGDERKQENVSYSEIPENLKDAFVSIEDQRFYTHFGVDLRRTGSAILNHFTKQKSSFGGSSITQQLVKNVTGNTSNTISRKVSEWKKAIELEFFLTKEQILEEYFNIIYLAPNIYGVKLSAIYYFDKDLNDLTLEECAFLAGINHTPNSYNPFNKSDNTDKIKKRTKTVLSKMLELGYISDEEYNEATNNVDKGLNFKKGTVEAKSNGIYSYHTDALIIELTNELEEKYNIPEEFSYNLLYMGNLKIYSTENKDIQKSLETEFEKTKYILPATNENNTSSQAAMVIIDHTNGEVVGTVGGLGKKETPRGFNRATQALRQTGSSSKPLSVLAPAFSENVITAASIYLDEETTFYVNEEETFSPSNYNSYRGEITIRQALESSQNIPFVKIIEQITPQKSIEYLENFGITTLTEKDNTLSLSLGGLSKGISPLQMAAAYATIANDGRYIEPTFYKQVLDNNNSVIIKSKSETHRVLSKEVSFILKDLLTEPVKGTNGTAPYCAIKGMSVAAKTGTTNDNFDKWLCGFTPYYTAATWYGYDYNETINYDNKNPAGILWANVMIKIHKDLDKKEFIKPASVKALNICQETGELATDKCEKVYTEYFTKNNIPKKCSNHSDGNLLDEIKIINENTTKKYTLNENIVVDVIDDIKSTFKDITANYDTITTELTSEETSNKIENISTKIIEKIKN